jgi:hypothetical protein
MNRKHLIRYVGVMMAIAVVMPMAWTQASASAAGSGKGPCSANKTQSTGIVEVCSSGGGSTASGGSSAAVDTSWVAEKASPGDGPCTDSNGNASWLTPLYQPTTGAVDNNPETNAFGSWPEPCIVQAAPAAPTTANLKKQAQILITLPAPTADFKGNFLTGAAVTFTENDPINRYSKPVPDFPGASIVATPASDFHWDFGDGQTGTGTSVQHTYQTTSPDPANPTKHTVTVKVSRTWNLFLNQPNASPNTAIQNVGTLTVTSQLNPDRTIVQVWSAQTEPIS